MARSRCKSVAFVFSRDEGMMKLVRALKLGHILMFLPDEDLGEKHSDFSAFFGVQKATLNTPVRIAKLKKADALPCYAWYDTESKRYKIRVNPPLAWFSDEKCSLSNADILNEGLEKLILLAPDQYMWLMKFYKTRPKGDKAIY
jgi:lauroyl/myristoyl acyltransferase